MRDELHFDAVVIGAGTAGLTAATRLAEHGAQVCVLAKGVGSTHLAPGTVDVLGYAPERVSSPASALEELIADRPDHPYAAVGVRGLADALDWFRERVAEGPLPGYAYVGGLERNHLLVTALGGLRPSTLAPATMAAGDMEERAGGGGDTGGPRRVCIVGLRALRDFHPALCAANLERAGIEARAIELDPAVERADQNALGFARRFGDPAWRAAFCAELASRLRADEHIGLPAVLGLDDPHGAWSDVQRRLGRPVFEVPTLPPSVPGMRLFEVLRSGLRGAGGRLVLGSEVVGCERADGRVTAVLARTARGEKRYLCRWVVLASGGLASGAIELDSSWAWHERVLGLPLRGLPGPSEPRFVPAYLDEQPVARIGVAVDGQLRAAGADNVLVAGAALPGAAPWREGSGEGIALASGYRAAAVVAQAEEAATGAAA